MGTHDHLWNELPFKERERLHPYMIESQLLHMRQARSLIVSAHKRELAELDAWIKNIEDDLRKQTSPIAVTE